VCRCLEIEIEGIANIQGKNLVALLGDLVGAARTAKSRIA